MYYLTKMTLSAKSKAASASLYLLLRQLDMGRDALVAAEGWGKWLLFWARLGEVWMTPFRAPTMARWFPCRAPIRPVARLWQGGLSWHCQAGRPPRPCRLRSPAAGGDCGPQTEGWRARTCYFRYYGHQTGDPERKRKNRESTRACEKKRKERSTWEAPPVPVQVNKYSIIPTDLCITQPLIIPWICHYDAITYYTITSLPHTQLCTDIHNITLDSTKEVLSPSRWHLQSRGRGSYLRGQGLRGLC